MTKFTFQMMLLGEKFDSKSENWSLQKTRLRFARWASGFQSWLTWQCLYLPRVTNCSVTNCSDPHFCLSLGINWLKSRKTDCSNPHQDCGPIEVTVLVVLCPFFFYSADKPAIDFPPNSSLWSAQKTEVLTGAFGPLGHHVLDEVSGHV